MENPFTQTDTTFKISFKCLYKDINFIEEMYIIPNVKELLSISVSEIESATVDNDPKDLWLFEVYTSSQPDIINIKKEFIEFCDINKINNDQQIFLEEVEDIDWVKQYAKELNPIIVGRFFISSLINKNLCPVDKLPIFIEASRAFGTGQHETTSGCVEALEYLADKNFNQIIDIGTGTGILAISSKKIWPNSNVVACDIEEIAVNISKENATLNNANILFYKNDESSIVQLIDANTKFDLIISNILATTLINLSKEISEITDVNGYVVLSGFLEYQMNEVLNSFIDVGFKYIHCINKQSWIILILKYDFNINHSA